MTCSINIKTQPRGKERDQSDWEGSNHKQQAENARKKTKTDIVNKKENQEKEPLNVKKSIAVGLYTDYHKPINTMGGGGGLGGQQLIRKIYMWHTGGCCRFAEVEVEAKAMGFTETCTQEGHSTTNDKRTRRQTRFDTENVYDETIMVVVGGVVMMTWTRKCEM